MKLNRHLKIVLAVIAAVGIVVLLVFAFLEGRKEFAAEQERERPIKAPSRVSVRDGEIVIMLDQPTRIKSGIAVAALESANSQKEIKAYGTVVGVDGITAMLNRYIAAKQQAEETRIHLEVSQKEYARKKELYESKRGFISEEAFLAAEGDWRADKAASQAAQDGLRVLEGEIQQQWGEVIARWMFSNSPALDRLLQQQDALIRVTLSPDEQLAAIPPTALVQIASTRSTSIPAKFVSAARTADSRFQGLTLYCTASASSPVLLAGMNLTAYLPMGDTLSGVIVPLSAVVWWQGKAWVYAEKDSNQFVRYEISTDHPVKEGWFVAREIEGLSPRFAGLVMKGAQLLLSEEFRSQIQVGEEEEKK